MVVAKRQRKEKPGKIEQRKIRRPDGELEMKKTVLLTSPIFTGQAQGGEETNVQKEEAKTD